jgi:hypothetical protein
MSFDLVLPISVHFDLIFCPPVKLTLTLRPEVKFDLIFPGLKQ